MDSAKLNDWAQVIGIFALVGSLIFIGLQMQQDRRLAAAQVIVAADSVQMDFAALISDNRDVWDRGLKGEELSAADEMAFRAVARGHFQRHLGVYQRLGLLGLGSGDSMVQKYAFDLYQYPSLRKAFLQMRDDVSARRNYFGTTPVVQFDNKVMEALERMDEAPPQLGERSNFPF